MEIKRNRARAGKKNIFAKRIKNGLGKKVFCTSVGRILLDKATIKTLFFIHTNIPSIKYSVRIRKLSNIDMNSLDTVHEKLWIRSKSFSFQRIEFDERMNYF